MLKALCIGGLAYGNAFAPTLASGGVRAFSRSGPRMAVLGDFTSTSNAGAEVPLSSFKGKPVLVLNVASLWGTTVQDFTAMNALAEKYGDKLAILAYPCNQFGHQTNENDDEFLNTLKYVRPGDGFELKEGITVMKKGDVNGMDAQPVFKWMKEEMMFPAGELGDTKGNGCSDIDALVLPRGAFGGSTVVLWTPVARSDIAWNFEKFLFDAEGKPVKRYSRYFDTNAIASDIDALL